MLSSHFIRIVEEIPIQTSNRDFKFICFRAVRGFRQEMILVRLPVEMKAGKEMWELIKATQAELKAKLDLDAISTLGAVTNCVWTSMAGIQDTSRSNVVCIAQD